MEPGVTSLEDRIQVLKRRPGSLSFASVAEELRLAGRHQEALHVLEEGLRFHPTLISARVVAAQCKAELRRFADALSDLDLALEEAPENLKARKLRAEIYILLHQHKPAMRELTDIVGRYPQDTDSVQALEKLEDFLFGPVADSRFAWRASSDAIRPRPVAEEQVEAFHVASVGEVNTPPQEQPQEIPAEPTEEPAFATRTIAELYMRQGLEVKARRVLETLLRQNPTDTWARDALRKLNEQSRLSNSTLSAKTARSSKMERIRRLERFLAAVSHSS
ncbi:MAG: hypothetical protein HUU37_02340 [Bdellovibrionales bacterium]|nr:hypothetical protein [Bdellovibrionales bacterium]